MVPLRSGTSGSNPKAHAGRDNAARRHQDFRDPARPRTKGLGHFRKDALIVMAQYRFDGAVEPVPNLAGDTMGAGKVQNESSVPDALNPACHQHLPYRHRQFGRTRKMPVLSQK